ncbi:EVE domain-containing protein [uncultured Marinobacter sp.]|mgnify:CR=1 FL=1|uniref:EVE domain-containing protein n=1 Tax=uncultured Marinobacter sp. TaxID=187379 RepID=UPI0030D828DA|tara:strand:- start:86 stop:553 length:468 start_codon:yes stop_codon:yes gene_type:complete
MTKWLVKTEPEECSIDDFAAAPEKSIPWDGVRNYQARNFLQQMKPDDRVFIYHSSCKHIGIAGVVKVVRAAYPDPKQFDEGSPYFDPKRSAEKPRWYAVDMQYDAKLPSLIPLEQLKTMPELQELALVKRGNRLSVMPVSEAQWEAIRGTRKNAQ